VKLPTGTTVISGQLLHSLKVSFGLSARSWSGDMGLGVAAVTATRPIVGETGANGIGPGADAVGNRAKRRDTNYRE
jgi:hypothetical protein